MINEIELFQMDKSRPLAIKECTRTTTCAINGCPLDEHSWCVTLPGGRLACSGCASDRGWEVR